MINKSIEPCLRSVFRVDITMVAPTKLKPRLNYAWS